MSNNIQWNDFFIYDKTLPTFLKWNVDVYCGPNHCAKKFAAGTPAGFIDQEGYVIIKIHGKAHRGHKVVWEMMYGGIPDGYFVDHIDRNRANNNIDNLRLVTHAVNCRNRTKQSNCKSGATGVSKVCNSNGTFYWAATWRDSTGKKRIKYFSIKKYGEDEAFSLACEYRKQMLDALIIEGLGYTEAHGK